MRQRHFIDSHKAATGLAVLALMAWYGRWGSTTAWVYLALHGTYGLLWVAKSRLFPDRTWEQPCSWAYGVGVIWTSLTLYWIAPWIITARDVQAPPWLLAAAVALWGGGVFLHFAADMQKWATLRARPGELVTGGLWARLRNPNYLGELAIYLAFAVLSMHWVPVVALGVFVVGYWVPNMVRKDRSLARYEEFEAWRARSWRFLPGVW